MAKTTFTVMDSKSGKTFATLNEACGYELEHRRRTGEFVAIVEGTKAVTHTYGAKPTATKKEAPKKATTPKKATSAKKAPAAKKATVTKKATPAKKAPAAKKTTATKKATPAKTKGKRSTVAKK